MAREFSSESLVILPKINVDEGLTLWQTLRAAVAAEKKLPLFLHKPWQGVESAGTALSQAAQTRFTDSSSKVPSAERRKADITVDNAAGALDDYLAAWLRLPGTLPEVQVAAAVRQRLFPDGTAFLNLPFTQEWAQLDRRLTLMKSEGLDKQIAQIGGERFVTHLQEAHLAYGQALGVTKVPAAPTETVALREPLDALLSALRLYVIKVTAYRDEEEPETVALAERLLRPLTTWTSRVSSASDDGEAEPETPPTPADENPE